MKRSPELGPPLDKYRRTVSCPILNCGIRTFSSMVLRSQLHDTDVGSPAKIEGDSQPSNWKFRMECVLFALRKYYTVSRIWCISSWSSFLAGNRLLLSKQLLNSETVTNDESDDSTTISRSFSESHINGNSTPRGSPAQARDSLLDLENPKTINPSSSISILAGKSPNQSQQMKFSRSLSVPPKSLKPKIKENSTTIRTYLQRKSFFRCAFLKANFVNSFKDRTARQRESLDHERELLLSEIKMLRRRRRAYDQAKRERMSQFQLTHIPILQVTPMPEELIPLTEDHLRRYDSLIQGPANDIIVFNCLQIKRSDIRTLVGRNWLNDKVINFYMNLLTERSEQRAGELPSVYAMNTFFLQRLMLRGHAGVKRWTQSVDLFSKDIIPVPAHQDGNHWCMAIIHMRNKSIRYFDSMGKGNQVVLDALESYLQEESLDKRHQAFDTSGFHIESVRKVPQQENSFDCGVFSCMFAEYITRDAPITFAQDNMEYFRKKMILEIADAKLWK